VVCKECYLQTMCMCVVFDTRRCRAVVVIAFVKLCNIWLGVLY
jgi:hypothetical protein